MEELRIGEDRAGSRRLVLVHGADLCGPFYRPLAELLARRGVVSSLLTLPGFDGQDPYDQVSWSRYASDIAQVVKDRGPCALVGHSMGGLMAFLAAARKPTGLTRLVLLEPGIIPKPWVARAASKRYLNDVVHGDRRTFVNRPGRYRRIADLSSFPPSAMDLYLRSRRNSHVPSLERLFSALPALCPMPFDQVQIPVLLLWGTRSGLPSALQGRALRRRFSYATLRWVHDAAHFMANEQDQTIAQYMDEFLNG